MCVYGRRGKAALHAVRTQFIRDAKTIAILVFFVFFILYLTLTKTAYFSFFLLFRWVLTLSFKQFAADVDTCHRHIQRYSHMKCTIQAKQ